MDQLARVGIYQNDRPEGRCYGICSDFVPIALISVGFRCGLESMRGSFSLLAVETFRSATSQPKSSL